MLFTWRLQLCFWLFMFRHLFFVSHCVAANRPLTTHVVRARVITFFFIQMWRRVVPKTTLLEVWWSSLLHKTIVLFHCQFVREQQHRCRHLKGGTDPEMFSTVISVTRRFIISAEEVHYIAKIKLNLWYINLSRTCNAISLRKSVRSQINLVIITVMVWYPLFSWL